MKAKRLRALLVAGLLSLAPAVTLTSCSGGGGGGGGNTPNTDTPNEDGDSSQTAGPKDYAPSTLKPCKIKFSSGRVVTLSANSASVWDSTQSAYSGGYWNYTKTGTNKGYLTVSNCSNTISTYPLYLVMKVSLRGEITFTGDNEACWDYTQTIVNTKGEVSTINSGGSCAITSLTQG